MDLNYLKESDLAISSKKLFITILMNCTRLRKFTLVMLERQKSTQNMVHYGAKLHIWWLRAIKN